jgi:protein TonB
MSGNNMSGSIFESLETTWDRSARRGWTTLASFAMQALGLSFLLAIPLLTVEGPPRLQWITAPFFSPPAAPAAPAPQNAQRPVRSSNMSGAHMLLPALIPRGVAPINDSNTDAPAGPAFGDTGVPGGIGAGRRGAPGGLGDQIAVAPPPTPAPAHLLRVSQWAESNIIYRVQPSFPPLARAARIQGAVRLRATISKTGTIENLSIVSGHPMLVASAIEAVKKWRYRPYLLNGEPIEVETEINVNFLLSGR